MRGSAVAQTVGDLRLDVGHRRVGVGLGAGQHHEDEHGGNAREE